MVMLSEAGMVGHIADWQFTIWQFTDWQFTDWQFTKKPFIIWQFTDWQFTFWQINLLVSKGFSDSLSGS